MPRWVSTADLCNYAECEESELLSSTGIILPDEYMLDTECRRFMYEHYTLISGILPFVSDEKKRCEVICHISNDKNISKQTIRNYLRL